MSKATGGKRPSESQKAKALWAMKAEEYCDPARIEDILGRTKTRLKLWEEHLKDQNLALEHALKCLENPYQGWPLVRSFSWPVVWIAMACSCVGA